MSFKILSKFRSAFSHKIHIPRDVAKIQSRNFGKAKKKKKVVDECPNKTCKPKKSMWSIFKAQPKEEYVEPTKEGCRRLLAKQKCEPDPDLSEFGDAAFKTCGSAYVVQKNLVEKPCVEGAAPEDKVLEKLERHPDLKDMEDPMPHFESVEDRTLKLCELRLHPDYKRHMSMTKPQTDLTLPKYVYKSRSGPIADDEYPSHLKISKECLDRKNVFSEFKRSEPPRQLLAKMLEIKQNEKPTLERKDSGTGVFGKDKHQLREKVK